MAHGCDTILPTPPIAIDRSSASRRRRRRGRTSRGWCGFTRRFRRELLARGLAPGGLARGLLRTSHGVRWNAVE